MRPPRHRVVAEASPFNCEWIAPETVGNLDGFTYAMCTRLPEIPRMVSEEECLYCPLWKEPPRVTRDPS